jgi:hypothetical protein
MATKQGGLDLLNDPIAQEMLQAPIPLRLAYNWLDGSPRCIPIGFHWTGSEIIIGSPPDSPKMKALTDGSKVAVTIDGNTMPYHVLLLRGTVTVSIQEGIIPEYIAYSKRYFGEEGGNAWIQQLTPICPAMARITIQPTWAAILDFDHRFPSALERAMGM